MVGSAAWLEKTLGRYRLEAIVGEGGMGTVFRARDTSLDRDVAVKILLGAPDATARKRFMREARAAAMLAHPNVVTIHDVGEHEGVPYVVMELVRGTSLRAFVGLPMPPSSTRLRWLIDAASALGAAHHAKLVHRDVKPENVLLSDGGVVKVVDFGIARSAQNLHGSSDEAAEPALGKVTAEGAILGTPAYMAPEHIEGLELDGRADQFAWGVMAYELLTGELPWGSRDDDFTTLVARLLMHNPPPPSEKVPLPAAVDEVILRVLAKNRDDRFPNMEEVKVALALAAKDLGGEPEGVPAPRGHAFAMAATAAASNTPLVDSASAARPLKILDAPLPTSESPGAVDAYRDALRAFRDGSWRRAQDALLRALTLDPKLPPAVLRYTLMTRWAFLPAVSREWYSRALELREAMSGRDRAVLNVLEPLFYREPPDVVELQRRLEAMCEARRGDAELLVIACNLSRSRSPRLSLEWSRRALEIDPDYADALQTSAIAHASLGDITAARELLERSVEVSPTGDDAYDLLARASCFSGDIKTAERNARRCIAVRPSLTGYELNAGVLYARGRPMRVVREMLRGRLTLVVPSKQGLLDASDDMNLLVLAGDFDGARECLRAWEASCANQTVLEPHGVSAEMGVLLELEVGDRAAAAARAKKYLEDRDLWARPLVVECDPVGLCAAVATRAGELSTEAGALERTRWLEEDLGAPGLKWGLAYGRSLEETPSAELQEEARSARPDSDAFGFFREPLKHFEVGLSNLRLGERALAIQQLSIAAASLLAPTDPFRSTHASFYLGEALEGEGRGDEAAAAYRVVLDRWGSSKSVTAQKARERLAALGAATSHTGAGSREPD